MTDTVISCISTASVTTGDCSETAVSASQFSITASADPGSLFAGWVGCDSLSGTNNEVCTISLDADRTVTASFLLAPQINGRMTGGGSFFAQGVRYTHGFELDCDMAHGPNNLEINWGNGNRFKLTSLISATCTGTDLEGKPIAGFDTYEGVGLGSLNGGPEMKITFRFTDRGEPGKDVDEAEFSIIGGPGVARTTLDKGNHQAHPKK